MTNDIEIKNHLASFKRLTELGVANAFTYSNEVWGNMRLREPGVIDKYEALYKNLDINDDEILYVDSSHNDQISFLYEENKNIFKIFNKVNIDEKYIAVPTDGIITKLQIPVVIAVADCAVICITGIDKKDGRRFVSSIHAGAFGITLDIHKKALNQIYCNYEPAEIEVFIFPSISGDFYRKPKINDVRAKIIDNPEWGDYLDIGENDFAFYIEEKIISDFEKAGIEKIYKTGVETFSSNKKGKLFSSTYNQTNNLPSSNFAVVISIL